MQSFTILSFAALAALTAAAPHANKHALHHRSLELATLVERSDYGACGASSGSCGAGYCCSAYGYCGTSAAYCAAGCQSAFGTCSDNSTTTSTSTSSSSSSSSLTITIKNAAHNPSYGRPGQKSTSTSKSTSVAPVSTKTTTTVAPTSTTTKISTTTFATSTLLSTTTTKSTASTSVVVSSPAPTTSSAATSTSSTAAATSTASSGGSGSDTYKTYTGVGTVAAGWPAMSAWVNFDSMWTANMVYISISCTQFGEPNNSDQESADLKTAIENVASSSSIDERFILAVVMQESKGCVRAPTTNGGVVNPGLMQDHDGTGTCNNAGTVQNPCPQSEITQMIEDGTTGTAAGDGLEQCLTKSLATDVSKYYKAARIYNSGSIAASGKLEDGVATHCYASDIANRLTGWVTATSTCNL